MDRSFVIAHMSDLHLDGSGRLHQAIEGLVATIRQTMAEFADVPDRILLITGDLVSEPTPRALDEALSVISTFRQTGLFTDIQAVAGNRDVRPLGLLGRRHDIYDYLNLPRTSKNVYYRQSGLDLVLLDSNAASLANGNFDQRAYHAVVAQSARLSAELAGSLSADGRADYIEPAENLVRVLALHHHPLPQATGEGKRFLGNPDEPMMYLASPATFLEAATSLNVNFILHGHRHVEGLTRYSIPNPRATSSGPAEDFWRTLHVLSCPSSTGQGGDDAGFNIVHFGPSSHFAGRRYGFSVIRHVRPRDEGTFHRLDSNLPDGIIRLPAGRDFCRDPAFQAAIDLSSCELPKREQIVAIACQLLKRRAFYDDGDDWAYALHAALVTSRVWSDLDGKTARSGAQRDAGALTTVGLLLDRLIAQAADVLGIDGEELENLRAKRLIDQADVMRELPRTPRNGVDLAGERQRRLGTLRELSAPMQALGADLDLGGPPPAGTLR
ncbi:metallophosphoesterase [Bradyrhizobium manausense]|uniref:metallophosphoesterase family protein n=1 Tax=Bradyrhizobium TaxID=374 RepID=UPI001BAB3626|nr:MULTISPECIES: metallophosphoesterase [Bradyrhizobium]MBR0825415.1 metallophosphoesterase [Bradyrhizobium manausense]UVO30103.1 metallophosphoesterase [Bradyrhizobium arachidis]